MSEPHTVLRAHARAIWQAAVAAVQPGPLIEQALADPQLDAALKSARHIIVVGAGKAGAAMSAAVENCLTDRLDCLSGLVNVPAESVKTLHAIGLYAARPAGTNQPTAQGVDGAAQILDRVARAQSDDVVLCLLSGGGSALLPAPAAGISLTDKQHLTRLLHASGATINEMNAVRKHLSRIKGGQLVRDFHGKLFYSLIISDVIGDPLDVIASGPSAADPTTFGDAWNVLRKYDLETQVPDSVRTHLTEGMRNHLPETPKELPANVVNRIIGNNARALAAAQAKAAELGYRVLNLGAYIEGETRHVATALAGVVRSIRADGQPLAPPVCILSGGETTVTLVKDHGRGGRNQEFVLAALDKLGAEGLRNVVLLSGGTDGEDGPTDAAGAVADESTLASAARRGLTPAPFLARNDAYAFFQATGDLLITGLTQTNVMDVRVILAT